MASGVNPLAKICLYLSVVLLIGALAAPPVFWGYQLLVAHGWAPDSDHLTFRRMFNRVVQVAAVVLLWPAFRFLDIRSLEQLGLGKNPRKWRDLAVGMLVALLPVLLFAAVAIQLDVYRIRKEILWSKLPMIAATAAGVAVFEEFLFRGVLLGIAVRSMGWKAGLPVISAFFAIVHFVRPGLEIERSDVAWSSGFRMIAAAFSGAPSIGLAIAGSIALFLIGMILGWARLRTASLFLPIGMHAGWIMGQQVLNVAAKFRVKDPESLLPWFGPNVVSGMVPTGAAQLAALLVSAGILWWYLSRAARNPSSPGDA